MILQHPFHNEIRSYKTVSVHTVAQRAVERRHSYRLLHHRHMAVLARLPGRVIAMLPLLVRNLFGKSRYLLAFRPKRRSDQRVAASAKTRIAHMVAPRRE